MSRRDPSRWAVFLAVALFLPACAGAGIVPDWDDAGGVEPLPDGSTPGLDGDPAGDAGLDAADDGGDRDADGEAPDEEGDDRGCAADWDSGAGEATCYPIVLVHGMGSEAYFAFVDYFHGVVAELTELGYSAHAPVVPLLGHSADRAVQLAAAVDAILAETGAERVHLVGHSQGGLDIRVLISGLGYADRVASATTVSTPHGGLRSTLPFWLAPMDVSEEYMNGEFDEAYPDDPAVPAFSWAGATCLATDLSCQSELGGEVVAPQLATTYWAVALAHGDDDFGGANDGAVPVASARWGELLGIIPADHFDEIGHIPGQRLGPFSHTDFYVEEARRLRQLEIELGL